MTKKIKVGFTPAQRIRVNEFLNFIRQSAEKELGTPVDVTIDWSPVEGEPRITLVGASGLEKVIPINDILMANDDAIPAPVLRVVKGGQGE